MIFEDVSSFAQLLEKRRKDFPQAIVAGWMAPDGRPVGAASQACDKTPTEGELVVSYACCLAACFKKLDELTRNAPPENRERLMAVIDMMTDGMEIVARFRSELVSPAALAGARDDKQGVLFD